MKKYLIIVEKTPSGYSAYSPDVPGCGSTGAVVFEGLAQLGEGGSYDWSCRT